MSDYSEIKVSAMVTVTLTPEQAEAYAEAHGTGLVSLEIRGRFRNDVAGAVQQIPWVAAHATVEVAKPVIVRD